MITSQRKFHPQRFDKTENTLRLGVLRGLKLKKVFKQGFSFFPGIIISVTVAIAIPILTTIGIGISFEIDIIEDDAELTDFT